MKTFFSLMAVFILSIFSIQPLISMGFFPMHDDTQPSRVFEMTQELKEGQFPVRWVSDLGYGYGYPLFNFYAPFPYYIGAVFNLSGFDSITSTKIMMGIGMITAGIAMFLLCKELGGYVLGITSALLYQYAPYHALDLYVRGAVGELYAYAFLPIIAWGAILIFKSKYKKGTVIYALGIFLILISHNVLGMITLYFSVFTLLLSLFFLLVKRISLKKVISMFVGLFLGIGLSAFFTFPAFFEKDLTKVAALTKGGSNFQDHFVSITQLWDFPWGYGGSAPGLSDGMSFKIGKTHILLAFFSALVFASGILNAKNKRDKKPNGLFYISLLSVFVSIFFALSISRGIWQILPDFSFIQYPWRFLNFVILFLCMTVSLGFSQNVRLVKLFILGVTLLGIFATYLKYFQPQYLYEAQEEKYVSKKALNWDISRISDEYMPFSFVSPKSYEEVLSIDARNIEDIQNMPGQRINSPVRSVSNGISLLSAVLLGYGLFRFRNSYEKEKKR